jgi:hypothetical protein
VRRDRPLDPAKVKKVVLVTERFFHSQSRIDVITEASMENLSPSEVKVVFKISGHNF